MQRKTHRSRPARWNPAIILLLLVLCVVCVPEARPDDTAPALRAGSVTVVPFVFLGKVDDVMTGKFLEKFTSAGTGWKLVDAASVSRHLTKKTPFRSDTKVESLLKAAKAAGAEAIIVGRGAAYKFLDAPGVALEVRMLRVPSGEEIHSGLYKETAWKQTGAREEAAETAAKRLVKEIGGK
jgi:hypothetical protein